MGKGPLPAATLPPVPTAPPLSIGAGNLHPIRHVLDDAQDGAIT